MPCCRDPIFVPEGGNGQWQRQRGVFGRLSRCRKPSADAQAALLSLVFNRGTRKSGSIRREMKALETLIANADLDGIATEILKMKRLREGKGLDSLLRRREHEAALVKGSRRDYDPEELVQL